MSTAPIASVDARAELASLQDDLRRLIAEIQRVIVGEDHVIEGVVTCVVADGHALLEGVPGVGKTLLIRTLAQAVSLSFARVQFTPDLMPADIVGTSVLVDDGSGGRELRYQPGPVFANIVLADEINRATPKTQSALLEAMAEGTVTAAGRTRPLPAPFVVLATQNPLEMEGTYPLPEAQLDRFMLKLRVDFPAEQQLIEILERTTGLHDVEPKPVLDGARVLAMRETLRALPVAPSLVRRVVRLVRATHPGDAAAPELVRRYVRYGASPRGAQAVLRAARVRAALAGRIAPAHEDVSAVVPSALRHRVMLNFEGEAEGIDVDACLAQVLERIPVDDRP